MAGHMLTFDISEQVADVYSAYCYVCEFFFLDAHHANETACRSIDERIPESFEEPQGCAGCDEREMEAQLVRLRVQALEGAMIVLREEIREAQRTAAQALGVLQALTKGEDGPCPL